MKANKDIWLTVRVTPEVRSMLLEKAKAESKATGFSISISALVRKWIGERLG